MVEGRRPTWPASIWTALLNMSRTQSGGAPTRFICGYLSCDPVLCRPLLAALPKVLTVSLRRDEKTDWVERSFVYAVAEAARLGLL